MASPSENNKPFDEEYFRNNEFFGGELTRPTSAPPILELSSASLFAFRADYAQVFSDIRCEESYQDFYDSYDDQSKLPPPLDTLTILNRDLREDTYSDGPHQGLYSTHNPRVWEQPLATKFSNLSLDEGFPESLQPDHHTSYADDFSKFLQDDSRNIESLPYFWDKQDKYQNQGFSLAPGFNNQSSYLQQKPSPPVYPNQPFSEYGFQSHIPHPGPPPGMGSSKGFGQKINRHPPQSIPFPLGGSQLQQPQAPPKHLIKQQPPQPLLHKNVQAQPVRQNPLSGILLDQTDTSEIQEQTRPSEAHSSSGPQVCRYFLQGTCNRGNRCVYSHIQGAADESHDHPREAHVEKEREKERGGKEREKPKEKEREREKDKPHDKNNSANRQNRSHNQQQAHPHAQRHQPHSQNQHPQPRSGILPAHLPNKQQPSRQHQQPHHHNQHQSNQSDHDSNDKISPRALNNSENSSRWTTVEQVLGQVYSLSKDQHGCRFLQKKLEENNPRTTDSIFNETFDHIVELMTDPFGNYLCQKLLEHCSDRQRYLIIERVSQELVNISKNMHGTRAVQKLIEYLSSSDQIKLVISALRSSVVQLIQDLNGNHVIQRCLNRLTHEDNQFIYDAVAGNCVAVASHRHGCCVLQRCIDHASEKQKIQLVREITANSLLLVQDPYGNYVVQYVLDLSYQNLSGALIKKFSGHLFELSTQKFSSNVIEKCLSVADGPTRVWMIEELLNLDGESLSTMLQDPYANYVIQTALSVSQGQQHSRLVETIRPHLVTLRNTPYGKRIQNKIMKETSPHYR